MPREEGKRATSTLRCSARSRKDRRDGALGGFWRNRAFLKKDRAASTSGSILEAVADGTIGIRSASFSRLLLDKITNANNNRALVDGRCRAAALSTRRTRG